MKWAYTIHLSKRRDCELNREWWFETDRIITSNDRNEWAREIREGERERNLFHSFSNDAESVGIHSPFSYRLNRYLAKGESAKSEVSEWVKFSFEINKRFQLTNQWALHWKDFSCLQSISSQFWNPLPFIDAISYLFYLCVPASADTWRLGTGER